MITQAESGLGSSDYNYLQSQESFGAFSLEARRFFGDLVASNFTNEATRWAAWDGNDTIYYVQYGEFTTTSASLMKYVISTNTVSRLAVLNQGLNANVYRHPNVFKPAIYYKTSDNTIHIWYHAGNNTVYERYNTSGTRTSGPTTVLSGFNTLTAINYDYISYLVDFHRYMPGLDPASSGPVFTASTFQKGFGPENAFDNFFSTSWIAAATTGILTIDLSKCSLDPTTGFPSTAVLALQNAGVQISSYSITSTGSLAPRNWTFQGSNDNSSWTTLHTVTGSITWGSAETRNFTVSSPGIYKYYRLNVTLNNSGASLMIQDLTFPVTANPFIGASITTGPSGCQLAATSDTDSYIAYYNSGVSAFMLRKFTSITTNHGDICALPAMPFALDAVRNPDDGYDYVAVSTVLPGQASAGASLSQTYSFHQLKAGIMIFRVDPTLSASGGLVPVATLENIFPSTNIAEIGSIAISYTNGRLYLTAEVLSNRQIVNLVYVSEDGVNWSMGFDAGLDIGKIIATPTYTFCKGKYNGSELFGNTPASAKLDLTDLVSSALQISQSPVTQIGFTLENDDGAFDNHAWFNNQNLVILKTKVGYWPTTNGNPTPGGTKVLVSLPDTVVDSFSYRDDLPTKTVGISARDFMAFLTDYMKARQPVIISEQVVGADTYDDRVGTNYSGLSHTAIQSGGAAWSTAKGSLIYTPPTTRVQAMVIDTAAQPAEDLVNGVSQIIDFKLHDNTASRIGIVFRQWDAKNYWMAEYDANTDKVTCTVVSMGAAIATSSASAVLNWKTNITTVARSLRVEYRWHTVKVYKSDDGVTWSLLMTYTPSLTPFVTGNMFWWISAVDTWTVLQSMQTTVDYFTSLYSRSFQFYIPMSGGAGVSML